MISLKELFDMGTETLSERISPYFIEYHFGDEMTLPDIERLIAICNHINRMVQPEGKVILDAACGFGIKTCNLVDGGASRVIGIDIQKNAEFLRVTKLLGASNVIPLKGNAENLPLADSSVDVVIATEAVSHISDSEEFVRESFRVLRQGGLILIQDANPHNRDVVILTEKQIREVENDIIQRRREMIRAKFPDISDDALHHLAENTRGLFGQQIYTVVESFLRTGSIEPLEKYDNRDPETGYWHEKLWSPFEIEHLLRDVGFSSIHIYPADHDILTIPMGASFAYRLKVMAKKILVKTPKTIALKKLHQFIVTARK